MALLASFPIACAATIPNGVRKPVAIATVTRSSRMFTRLQGRQRLHGCGRQALSFALFVAIWSTECTRAVLAAWACEGTATVTTSDWKSAAALASHGLDALPAAFGASAGAAWPWEQWGRSWVPFARNLVMELERNLHDCPEATVAALMHSLPALTTDEDDALTLEIVKHLHHLLSDGRSLYAGSSDREDGPLSAWQQQWLLSTASLLRFVYLKWVNVPQDENLGVVDSAAVVMSHAHLRPHHEFLFRHSLDAFVSSGVYEVALTENSVLFSEAFAFVSFCKLHDVDLVVESGIYKGSSTEMWSLNVRDVVAMDIFVPSEAEARLGRRQNVQVLTGDGRQLLSQVLQQHVHRKTAVFIDGPKGELAIRLGLDLLRRHEQLAFVAIHDMAPYRGELIKYGAFFFTDEPWYQAAYGHLDAPFRTRPDIEAGGTMAFLPRPSGETHVAA
eukprot:TRINITY_DN28489_c0_g1_i1.p1 TRINITY_DN28489_c0_g1~~TRINITY_DN28489_c0_g1_i1.p1  ORF type:complete len:446 (+),score=60.56 TRINITY_DN28489_c0_g1_i1:129-1466(+)